MWNNLTRNWSPDKIYWCTCRGFVHVHCIWLMRLTAYMIQLLIIVTQLCIFQRLLSMTLKIYQWVKVIPAFLGYWLFYVLSYFIQQINMWKKTCMSTSGSRGGRPPPKTAADLWFCMPKTLIFSKKIRSLHSHLIFRHKCNRNMAKTR